MIEAQLDLYSEIGEFALVATMNAITLHQQTFGNKSIAQPDFPITIFPFITAWFNYAIKTCDEDWGSDELLTESLTCMLHCETGEKYHYEDLLEIAYAVCWNALADVDFTLLDASQSELLNTCRVALDNSIKKRAISIAPKLIGCKEKHHIPEDGKYFTFEVQK